MKKSKKSLEIKLDKLWRTVGKEYARCEICETLPLNERINYTQIHPHHIIGRLSRATRWEIENRIWLCPVHHSFGTNSAHNNPMAFMEWLEKHKPEQYAYTRKHKNDIKNWTIAELEELIQLYTLDKQ